MDTDKLKIYFSKFDTLLLTEIDAIVESFEFSTLKKDAFFAKENQVCKKIGFILRGGVKAFATDTEGNENITCFKFEESFISSYESFMLQKASKKNIQAIEDCEILTITYDRFNDLLTKISALQMISKTLIESEFIEKENYLISFNNKSAKEKYTYLLSQMPEIIKRVKAKDISSYLGITERTLNRSKNAIL